MSESSTNILNLSESSLSSLKKSDLVQRILDLKGEVIVHTDLHKLSNQIHKLAGEIDQILLKKQETYKWTGYHKKCEQQVRGKDNKFRKKSGKRRAV